MPVPSAPVLTLTSASTTANIFTWPDVANETSYRLEFRTGDGSWSTATSPAANATTSTHTATFTRNVPYSYRLFAVNATGDSAASNIVHTTLPPATLPTPSTSKTALFPVPALPTRPAAGGMIYDPTFGTPIYRITDVNSFAGSPNGDSKYSYWPTFNSDNTRLQATLDGHLCEFSATTKVISNCFLAGNTPDGPLSWETSIWAGQDANALYGVRDTTPTIWKGTISGTAITWTAVRNLTSLLNADEYPHQISKSLDDNRFGFRIRSTIDYTVKGYGVYQVSTDTMLYRANATVNDEVQIDKSGRYLVVKTSVESPADAIETIIVDLNNSNTTQSLTAGTPDFGFGHSDLGTAIAISADDWTPAIRYRALGTPHTHNTVVTSGGIFWNTDGHISMLANDESHFLYSVFGDQNHQGLYPYSEEIVRISTDGNESPIRYLHHRSVPHDPNSAGFNYWGTPRANISRGGRFIAFTSDWGTYNGRRDLFVADIGTGSVPVCRWDYASVCQ